MNTVKRITFDIIKIGMLSEEFLNLSSFILEREQCTMYGRNDLKKTLENNNIHPANLTVKSLIVLLILVASCSSLLSYILIFMDFWG